MSKRKRGDKIMLELIALFYIGELIGGVIGLAIFGLVSWFFIGVVVSIIDAIINTILSIPTIVADWFTSTSIAILNWITNIPTEMINWVTTLL